jgi:membrane protease YdiL (CAAX protease family)
MLNDSSKTDPKEAPQPASVDAESSDIKVTEAAKPVAPPVKKWPGVIATILWTAVIFVVGQGIGGAIVYGIARLSTPTGSKIALFGSEVWLQFAYAAMAYGLMIVVLLWMLRRRKLMVADLGLKQAQVRDVGWAVVAFLAYMSAYVLVISVLKPFVPGLDVDQKQDVGFSGAHGITLLPVFVALAVIAPIVEELLMRGFLFTSLRRKSKFWIAAIVTSAIFASLHLAGGESGAGLLWIAAIDTFVLSLVLCYLREETGRLWAGIGLHMIKNSIAFIALFILAS